ncbi:GNAT family N-acetyltransferase [Rossellomorea marisflavi]|uniref:GNAT family N-acetyltransferase n=1 Tax=Rossellomorea marisflavi TaxID=189381 RepID=UPI00203DFE00|nr:GNAT family N-acetyltransferase [Rossellomorea marisflavi]MCM2605752.1 GNAT family N-acetyltransferase [Rossellomorea marisflavi]
MNIKKATLSDLESIAHLFNEYRIFYKSPSNTEGAKTFIQERLTTGDSVIFLAGDDQGVIGFTQLYPTFTSIGMKRAWILNDLYVSEDARGAGVGQALLHKARTFARETGAASICLSTAPDNDVARRLYEKNGYRQDQIFLHYELEL